MVSGVDDSWAGILIAMKNEQSLREHVATLLKGEGAHVGFQTVMQDVPFEVQGKRPPGIPHSPWELLEHLRIAQWDILEYTRDANHVSPEFPRGYWPSSAAPPDGDAWGKSAAAFHADLKAMTMLVEDESNDLLETIPHTQGKSILREALLLADHNAYHLGQLVLVRRLLGCWAE
jgi:hypothetical protein